MPGANGSVQRLSVRRHRCRPTLNREPLTFLPGPLMEALWTVWLGSCRAMAPTSWGGWARLLLRAQGGGGGGGAGVAVSLPPVRC